MWHDGLTATQIARYLANGSTRNAVLGKVHRLGIADRAPQRLKTRQVEKSRTNRRFPRKPAMPKFKAVPLGETLPELHIPEAERKSLMELERNDCRWPYGDEPEDIYFCGKTRIPGLSYCEHHCRQAFRSAETRRSNDRVKSRPIHRPIGKAKLKVNAW